MWTNFRIIFIKINVAKHLNSKVAFVSIRERSI